jgi:hypothetical protein
MGVFEVVINEKYGGLYVSFLGLVVIILVLLFQRR